MVEMKDWFKGSEKIAGGNQQTSVLYKSIRVEKMMPDGFLESLDAQRGTYLSASGFPLCPKKETFALQTLDGHLKIRYFFNFDPVKRKTETTARFIYEGEPVILRITADEYSRAKKIFEHGLEILRQIQEEQEE